jgi:hypothetical protein
LENGDVKEVVRLECKEGKADGASGDEGVRKEVDWVVGVKPQKRELRSRTQK